VTEGATRPHTLGKLLKVAIGCERNYRRIVALFEYVADLGTEIGSLKRCSSFPHSDERRESYEIACHCQQIAH